MERYDIAVIGTGPAGVSAAITAKIRNKNILLIGRKNLSEKMSKAARILNYPGLPGISGKDLCANMLKQLKELGIEITDARVGTVYAMGDYFALQVGTAMYEASCCILAGGVTGAASLPGENEFMGRGVSSCATCDGQFYRGKTAAVIGFNRDAVQDSIFLSEICERVLFFPGTGMDSTTEAFEPLSNITVINEKPTAIKGMLRADTVETDAGAYKADGIFVIRDAAAADKLVPGLKLKDGKHVDTDRSMATSIPGLFACGDVTGTPYQYIKAAGEGNVAALSAVGYLRNR